MRTRYFLKGKQLIIVLLTGVLGFSGCNKFLDINQNPNNPDEAEPGLLLPTVEAALGQVVGNQFQVYGGIWSQYWTQNVSASQYTTLEQYNINTTASNTAWRILYRSALNNAQLIINDNETVSAEYYKAIAYILKAYGAQLATDAFGDVPLSEALNAGDYGAPHYDPQEVVYDSIFSYIDKGIALAKTDDAVDPGAQDMIFQGDMAKWIAFANTLKLRAYLRLSEVKPDVASSGIQALYDSGAEFLSADAMIEYSTVGGNENPLYNEMAGLGYTQNLVASETAVSRFEYNNDPRLLKLYDPLVEGSDVITDLPQGAYNNPDYTGKLYSTPSPLVGADANDAQSAVAPVKFISAAESYFLQAEAVARGWGSGDNNGKTLFERGIKESFLALGLTEDEAKSYIDNINKKTEEEADKTFDKEPIEAIITQKYYAMTGFQGFEAWTEWRRTGFPKFLVISEGSTLGADRWPLRLPYANSEVTSNGSFPGVVPIYEKVWWGKTIEKDAE